MEQEGRGMTWSREEVKTLLDIWGREMSAVGTGGGSVQMFTHQHVTRTRQEIGHRWSDSSLEPASSRVVYEHTQVF